MEYSDKRTFETWQAEQARELTDDDEEAIQAPTHRLDPETIRALILLVLPPPAPKPNVRRLMLAFKRFLVIAMLVDTDTGEQGFSALADALTAAGLPTTRASLSNVHCQLVDVVGIHRLGRSDAGRAAYAERAKRVWATRKAVAQS